MQRTTTLQTCTWPATRLKLRFRRETEITGVGRGVREAPPTESWTLKLPSWSDSAVLLTRTEVSWASSLHLPDPDRKRPARRASRGRSLGQTSNKSWQSLVGQPEGRPVARRGCPFCSSDHASRRASQQRKSAPFHLPAGAPSCGRRMAAGWRRSTRTPWSGRIR